MRLRDKIRQKRGALQAIAAKHGISNLRLFGSSVRGEEHGESDVDLLVDMAPDRGFGEAEGVLERRVDVVIERSLSPHFRPFIEAEVEPL